MVAGNAARTDTGLSAWVSPFDLEIELFMKIAMTGGACFGGSHLTTAYLNAGHDVLVIDNLAHGSRQDVDARARFYKVDVRDIKVQEILQLERPDVVNHHAAQCAATF